MRSTQDKKVGPLVIYSIHVCIDNQELRCDAIRNAHLRCATSLKKIEKYEGWCWFDKKTIRFLMQDDVLNKSKGLHIINFGN